MPAAEGRRRVARPRGLLLLLLCAPSPARCSGAARPRGRANCPCVNAWNDLDTVMANNTWFDQERLEQCVRGPKGQNGEWTCYPSDYGSSICKAWDASLPPYCADADGESLAEPPAWCYQPWCYVDPSNCALNLQQTSDFFSELKLDAALTYSYQTCDGLDMFSPQVLLSETFDGQTFRFGVPELDPPWITEVGEAPAGLTIDFMDGLAQVAGFDTTVEAISDASLEKHAGSVYDSCVWDVALERLDLCYGAFWATDERRAWTTFTSQMGTDEFFLVVAAEPDADVLTLVLKVFGPFDSMLWLGILSTCAAIGWSLWLFGELDGPDTKAGPGTKSKKELVKEGMRGTLIGMKAAVQTFLGQGKIKVKSKPAAIVLAGFGFMCMVGGASYTASLSSFLLLGSLKTQFKDVADAVKQRANICVPASIETILSAKYAEGADLWVPISSISSMTVQMDAGVCSCMILSQQYYDAMRAGVYPFGEKHCRKVKIGDSIVSVPLAAPIRPDLNQAMAYLMAQARFEGVLDALEEQYPPMESDCPSMTGLKASFEALKPQDLSACFLFTWIAIAIAIKLHIAQHKTVHGLIKSQVNTRLPSPRSVRLKRSESQAMAARDPSDTPSTVAGSSGVLLNVEAEADDTPEAEKATDRWETLPVAQRMAELEDKVGNIGDRVGKLEDKVGEIGDKVGRIEDKMDKILEVLSCPGSPQQFSAPSLRTAATTFLHGRPMTTVGGDVRQTDRPTDGSTGRSPDQRRPRPPIDRLPERLADDNKHDDGDGGALDCYRNLEIRSRWEERAEQWLSQVGERVGNRNT